MIIQKGNRVLVNVAPFIGSSHRNKDSIPCRVLSVKDNSVEIATEEPYRQLSLWISSNWIEEILDNDFCHSHEVNSTEEQYSPSREPHKRSSLLTVV
jgi:hypothetical protein